MCELTARLAAVLEQCAGHKLATRDASGLVAWCEPTTRDASEPAMGCRQPAVGHETSATDASRPTMGHGRPIVGHGPASGRPCGA